MTRWPSLIALLLLVSACGSDPKGPPVPALPAPSTSIDSTGFGPVINNPYYPLIPGTKLRYEGNTEDGHEIVQIEVTPQTRVLAGVETLAVKDSVTIDGKLVEDTIDWYAQDAAGNVWYFGEDTKEYENGKVTNTAGSWLAGVDGAVPGILMYATPTPGQVYRQEYRQGEAEDGAQVVAVAEHVTIGYGAFDQAVKILEFTPLEPGMVEYKYYARGVGLVLITGPKGENRTELVAVTAP